MLNADQIDNWEHGVQVRGHDRGPWSVTVSGKRFHPMDPDPEQLTLGDIAHHLAMVNRFGGATIYPYSVAQHTLLCFALVRNIFPGRVNLRRWALLHDAPEYVLGDMVRPVKGLLPSYAEMEDRLMAVIAKRFSLDPLKNTDAADLKYIDNLACVIERKQLLPNASEWHDMPTYVGGYGAYVMERSWLHARTDLHYELNREFE
jgi:uncharacterized protein